MMNEKTRISLNRTLAERVQQELLGPEFRIKRSLVIRTNSEDLSTNGELCFPPNLVAWRRLLSDNDVQHNCTSILEHYLQRKNHPTNGLTEQDILTKASELLITVSKAWPLPIRRCSLQKGRVCVFVDRTSVIGSVIKNAVRQDSDYGRQIPSGKSISMKISEDKDSDLTTARLRIIKETTERMLRLQGFDIVESDGDDRYLLTSKSEGKVEEDYRRYVCGVVKNQESKSKETSETWTRYVNKKVEELTNLVETKSSVLEDLRDIHKVAEAIVIFELLSVKPGRPVFVQSSSDSDKATSSSKGGSFVLYNTARISAILERFEEEQKLGNYPSLSDINSVDFSQLTQEEEWELIYNFILGYPEMIDNCVQHEPDFESCPQTLCLFLSRLSQKFSVYYRRIRVLTEGREHLIPTMMARLYLLRALQIVVNNSLAILNIVPVGHM